jgi:hypothetical protein
MVDPYFVTQYANIAACWHCHIKHLYATLVLQRTELHEDPKTPTALRILQDLPAQTVGTDLEPKQRQTPRIPIPKSSPKTIVAPIIPPDSAKCRAETLLAGDG